MAIPTFDELIRPVLELADREDITRRLAAEAMIQRFKLTPRERDTRTQSGTRIIVLRTSWAMTHLTKGRLIEKVSKATYRITDRGRRLLAEYDGPLTIPLMREKVPGFQEAWESAKRKKAELRARQTDDDADADSSVSTPEEAIDKAVRALDGSLQSELLAQLADIDPYRFEQVVLDVLSAMGYGGSRKEASEVTKKSGDEGIDGVINEDRLGLDVIYVQAKRWQHTVGRKEIQSFVGALAGRQANKGIFITTSDFASTAVEYAERVTQKVVLIDGDRLAELMIELGIGVSTTRAIQIKRIDSDYFEET